MSSHHTEPTKTNRCAHAPRIPPLRPRAVCVSQFRRCDHARGDRSARLLVPARRPHFQGGRRAKDPGIRGAAGPACVNSPNGCRRRFETDSVLPMFHANLEASHSPPPALGIGPARRVMPVRARMDAITSSEFLIVKRMCRILQTYFDRKANASVVTGSVITTPANTCTGEYLHRRIPTPANTYAGDPVRVSFTLSSIPVSCFRLATPPPRLSPGATRP